MWRQISMSGTTPRDGHILHDRTTYRFSILAARQTRYLSEMYFQKFGLSVSQWKVLPIIGYYGPMSAKEVGERTSLEPEKVTRAVDQLVARGFVTRRPDAKDRRRVVLSLAAEGKNVFKQSEQLRGAIEEEFLSALRPKERVVFHQILDKLERRATMMFNGKQAWRKIICQ
ncbi:MAG: MarR family transcriptional regulator [Rhizobiales bacterium]|nr:MarR family transcriptional regulator [Hyphomicrobiales bacterium]